jgi:hypothetical protein
MRRLFALIALTLLPSAAHATLCEDGLPTASTAIITPAIDATLQGDYRALTAALNPAQTGAEPARQQMIADLERMAPLGYDDCAVLVARPLGPDFEVFILMFAADGQRLYAFLALARIAGGWEIIHSHLSPAFAEVYDLLR